MKNLKKVLAFVLVVAMMASLVISASALSAKDFTDYSEIVNKDAVAMLTELKVINGYPTGDYQPSKVVTRAEMAKMIYTALMGGNDSAPVQTTNKYSDVWSGMWCEGYVAFCDELGIIAGYGDGTFGPNDTVTAVQAAKMLLVAMGYDAAKEGFVADPQWSYNILKVASAKGLFEGFNADTAAGCTRDNAALLIYNALKAETVTYVGTSAVDNGETLLGNIFGLEAVTGVVVANEYANLFGAEPLRAGYTEIALIGSHYIEQDQAIDPNYMVSNVKEAAEYVLTFVGELIGKGTGKVDPDFDVKNDRTEVFDEKPGTSWLVEFNRREAVDAWDEYNTLIFKASTELAVVGETVTVYAKVDANGDYTEAVVGNILVDDDCVVATYDGVDYEWVNVKIDKNTRYFVNYAMAWDTMGQPSRYWDEPYERSYAIYSDVDAISYNLPGETTKAIDVDGDGVVELVLKTRPVFAQANYDKYYDSWYFDGYYYEDGKDPRYGIADAAIVSESEFEDGDFVFVTYIDGTYYVEKAATVEGKVDKVSYTEEDYPYVNLEDGTKLDESGIYWNTVCTATTDKGPDGCADYKVVGHNHYGEGPDAVTLYSYLADCNFDDEYVFYLDAQGNVVAYAPKGMPMPQGKVALMTGSYIEGSKFEYALTYANEEGVTVYDVATNRFGDVEGSDADFFIEAGITAEDVNSGLLIGSTLFYRLSGYNTRIANHMAYILAQFDAIGDFAEANLNNGVYGYGYETALVSVSEKGEAVSAGAVTGKETRFVPLLNEYVTAGQYQFTGWEAWNDESGNSGDRSTIYATSKTVFFIYEKIFHEPTKDSKAYYEVNVYSFTGYKNLPQYLDFDIDFENETVTVNGVTNGYAYCSEDEASYIVLEVSTNGKTYANDLALVLERVYGRKNQVTVKYLNAEGKFCTDTFCTECSEEIVVGNRYAIVECEHGYALINAGDTLGYKDGNVGFFTGNKPVGNGEYFMFYGEQYLTTKDTAYYGIINVTTNDGRQTKAIIVKFNSYRDFAKYATEPVGVLWTAETNKRESYNQVNALISVLDAKKISDEYLGGVAHFVAVGPVEEVLSTIVDHPVVIDEEAGVVEDPKAEAAPEGEVPPQA